MHMQYYVMANSFFFFFTLIECVEYRSYYIQDTKTFPKCCVGRNGKQNQQKLHIHVCGSLKTQRNQGCQD